MLEYLLFLSILVKSDFDYEGFTYHILDSKNNEVQIVNCSITDPTIIIPSTVTYEKNEYNITSIATSTFSSSNISLFEIIYFPYTLIDIEEGTFMEFTNLERIGYIDANNKQINDTFPPLMKKLNANVFQSCKELKVIDLNNIVEIGTKCFHYSIRISQVTMRVVEIIGPYSFASIQLLQKLKFPSTLKNIQDYAFARTTLVNITGDASNLEIITTGFFYCADLIHIPNLTGVVEFQNKAFEGCSKLREIHCGPKLSTIYSNSFSNCIKLETFTTEATDYFISGEAFSHCSSLKNFDFSRPIEILNNAFEACESLDIIDMSKSKIQFINWQVFLDCGELSSVILPPQLTDFSLLAFEGCEVHSFTFTGTNDTLDLTEAFMNYNGDLFEVIFSPDCDVILQSTFSNCSNLSRIVLPTKPFELDATFSNCTNLTKVENLEYCTSFKSAFTYCTKLYSVILPTKPFTLDDTFSNCYHLTKVENMKYCTSIISAFASCMSLTQIDSLESLTHLNNSAFYLCSSLTSLPKLSSIKVIGKSSFEGCYSLKSIECGNQLISIDSNAFFDCSNLESFKGGSNSINISSGSFELCQSLSTFDFTKVKQIGSNAFDGCASITEVDLSNSIMSSIPSLAFADCISLTKVDLPNRLNLIGVMAFYGCTKLPSIDIFTSIFFSIYSSAFEGCTSLKIVSFESQPIIIFQNAFASCTALESVELFSPLSIFPTSIDSGAFENCTSLKNFDFSEWHIDEIGPYAFYNCPLSKKIKFETSGLFIFHNLTIYSHAFASNVIKIVDFRFDFYVLSMTNESFTDCPKLQCVMVDSSFKDQFTYFFKKSMINGIHCPNYVIANKTVLVLIIIASIVVFVVLIVIIVCVVKKKNKNDENKQNIATPLITSPLDKYQ